MSYIKCDIFPNEQGLKTYLFGFNIFILFVFLGCKTTRENQNVVLLEAESFDISSDSNALKNEKVLLSEGHYLQYTIDIPTDGRYEIEVMASSGKGSVWIEDYVDNTDDRVYNITGDIHFETDRFQSKKKYGSPLAKGLHPIKVHAKNGDVQIDWIKFTLMIERDSISKVIQQKMSGDTWELVWSDEFDGIGLPDTTKWTYNVGDWGWGNNELQYYTKANSLNTRMEDGHLIIQAHKNNGEWTSARLTSQGKFSFQYGKIEFRAKVPHDRGTWAAGWMLGSAYVDELSWPYCGEIDILECVGYEINDSSTNGLNHATCHTRKYHFKQGNQIGSDTTLLDMTNTFHTYAVEWYPNVIYGLVDGKRYFVYDKNKDALEWPFNNPQDIILNLAIGGGWGGAKGLDSNMNSPKFIVDYVRVYDLK